MDIQNQEQQPEQQQPQQDPNELLAIRNSIRNIELRQVKDLRRLLRLENLQNIEEITTLEYLMYVINSNSLRNALVKLQDQYKMMYRTLGDGNCFYRSIMLAHVFWMVEHQSCLPLETFIKKINNMQQVTTIFQTLTINANNLKSIFLLFLFKILEDKKKGQQIRMLDIIRYYNSLPEVDFASVIICRQLIQDTYVAFKEHESIRDFLDDDMKEKIEFVLLRYFYEAQYVIIPLAAQTFQCELNIQNFYKPDEYSSKVNIEKLNYSPLDVEDKNAQPKTYNLLYNGGHYELVISDAQSKSDFYSLNNKQIMRFNTKFSEQQYYYFTQNFIARYQTEIIRMNNIEESTFYSQQNNGSGEEYQTIDWQRLQRSDEYKRQIAENLKLKVLIEGLQYEPQEQNNKGQSQQQDNRSQSNSLNSTSSQTSNSQGVVNSKKIDGDSQNSIDVETDESVTVNQTHHQQCNSQKKNHMNCHYDQTHQNQQQLYQQFKQTSNNVKQKQGDNDEEDAQGQGMQEEKEAIDYNLLKKLCTSCQKLLPVEFRYPFWILPVDEEAPEDVVLKICTDCFKGYAKTYQQDQEFIEIRGQLYQLTDRIISEFQKYVPSPQLTYQMN